MARGESLIRQWNLLKALQSHRFGISSDELAERVGCSKRQVLRDLNVLQEVGFPISYEQRDYGKRFWKLSAHFIEREELMLTMTEMISLFIGQKLLAPLDGTQFGSGLATALEKIKVLLPSKALAYFEDLDNTLMVKSMAYHDYSAQNKQISIINSAIFNERVLKLTYKSANSKQAHQITYHPYGLVFMGVTLYCIGYAEQYDELRTLKINRILGVEMTDQTFERPTSFSLQTYTQGSFGIISSGKTQTIKVKFTGWAATNVREHRWHHSQKIVRDTQDSLVATFDLTDTTEFKRWLLGFGRHVVVLAPRKFQAEITSDLSSALAEYTSRGMC